VNLRHRDTLIKVEPLADPYGPLSPVPCSRPHDRDRMHGEGHEFRRVRREEIFASALGALVRDEHRDSRHRVLFIVDEDRPPGSAGAPGSHTQPAQAPAQIAEQSFPAGRFLPDLEGLVSGRRPTHSVTSKIDHGGDRDGRAAR